MPIRRSPCELYIKYLLVHPDEYSEEAIHDILVGQELDFPGEDYLFTLRRRMRVPRPFYPANKLHFRSYRFLSSHKILGFFHPDKQAQEAHHLLTVPRAKETIETMVLTGDAPAYIAHRVRRLGVACTAEGVERYCNYYWDLSLVDSTEAAALLKMRVERTLDTLPGVDPSRDQVLQHFSLHKARFRDPRRLAVEMPNSPMASLMNQLRMGIMPSQVELARLLVATRMAALCRASEVMMSSSSTDAARARDFTLTAKLITELIADIGSPDTELQKDLQQLVLETEEAELPHVKTLKGLTEGGPKVIDAEVEAEYVDSE